MPPEPGWNGPGLGWHGYRFYGFRPGKCLGVVVIRHEGDEWTVWEYDRAVRRLDGLDRRRALWFVEHWKVLRGERGVIGQVRVTEVSALDQVRHRLVGVVTGVEATAHGEECLAGWEVVRRESPATAPHAELEAGTAVAGRDHGVEGLGRGRDLDPDLGPVGDLGRDLLSQGR